MDQLRIGMIGCGEIAVKTAAAIAESAYAQHVMVMDTNAALAQDLGERYDVPWTDRVEDLLGNPDVDAVYIAVPHFLHAPLTIQAAEAGKHIFVEKPIALSLADAEAMIVAASAHGIWLSVNFHAQVDPLCQAARDLVAQGAIGNVIGTHIVYRGDKPASYWASGYSGRVATDWRMQKATSGGGVLIMNIIHNLNTMRFITGLEVVRIAAEYGTFDTPVEVEDFIAATYRYDNGAIGTIEACSAIRGRDPLHDADRIYGTAGQILLSEPMRVYSMAGAASIPAGEWYELPIAPLTPAQQQLAMVDGFARPLVQGEPPTVSAEDGVAALATVLAAYQSGAEGRMVMLERADGGPLMGAKVAVGLIGAGYAAGIHARAYRKVYGVEVELRAVAASRPERAAAFAAEFGVARSTSLAELLADPEIILVDICAPNSLHAELAIAAASRGKHVIVEKPLTGAFGEREAHADAISRERLLREAVSNAKRMVDAARVNGMKLLYAENWVYAPAIQKVQQLMVTSGGTILRIQGEESHSGSHASYARHWRTAGGGSLLGKGCHPLAAALYLKRVEGMARHGLPIRPRSVVAGVGWLTRNPAFMAEQPKFIRDGWHDVEDWGAMLVTFEDGSVAQVTASDAVLGGIRNCLTVYGSRAYAEANLNPNTACVAYAPSPEIFASEYISEKIETKAGWSFPSADEEHAQGYPQEIQDFVEAVAYDREPLSDAALAHEVVLVTYAAYLAAAEGRRVDLDAVRGMLERAGSKLT